MSAVLLLSPVQAQTFSVLHTFENSTGSSPSSGPIIDAAGNLYGTTSGGAVDSEGALYKIDPSGQYSQLWDFIGEGPGAPPLQAADGSFYGTTNWDTSCGCFTTGTVWNVSASGKKASLWGFTGITKANDGALPFSNSVALGPKGYNLYGVTTGIGVANNGQCTPPLCGTIYRLNAKTGGKPTNLHVFGKGKKDGTSPGQGLLQDASGNFFGSTGCGGAHGLGTIFELTNGGQYKVLYSFEGGKGSCGSGSIGGPWGPGTLVLDGNGNFYGTALSNGKFGFGMVFKLSAAGTLTDLHDFTGGADGANPWGGLQLDDNGNLYGVAVDGATNANGTVFQLDTSGNNFKVLYTFTGQTDGGGPVGLVLDKAGKKLFGATQAYGDPTCQCGTVFKLAL